MLDVYPNVNYRVSKDTNGGFGTANDIGDNFVSKCLSWYLKKSMDYPQLSLALSMGQLRKQGHSVSYSKSINNFNFDLYIVSSSIVAHETELKAIEQITSNNGEVIVIGPFGTSLPQPYINAGAKVLIGEPEFYFVDKPKTKQEVTDLPNVITFTNFFTADDLEYPAWDLIFKTNKPKLGFLAKGATLPILATRGCPYSCSYYCTYPLQQGKKVRSRDPVKVVEEMIYWSKILNVRNFQFRDPVFTINKKFVNSLCDEIIKSGYKFNLAAEFHLKDINEQLASKLSLAGLKLAFVGIESTSSEVLENAHRTTIPIDEQALQISLLEKYKIKVKAMYIFGMPADTIKTAKETIKYAIKLNTAYAQFSVFTPYPGTPAFLEYEKKISSKKYEDFNQWQLVWEHPNYSREDVRSLLTFAYTKYYTNFKWLIKSIYKFFS